MPIGKVRRLAHGYRNFDRLPMLIAGIGTRARRFATQPTGPRSSPERRQSSGVRGRALLCGTSAAQDHRQRATSGRRGRRAMGQKCPVITPDSHSVNCSGGCDVAYDVTVRWHKSTCGHRRFWVDMAADRRPSPRREFRSVRLRVSLCLLPLLTATLVALPTVTVPTATANAPMAVAPGRCTPTTSGRSRGATSATTSSSTSSAPRSKAAPEASPGTSSVRTPAGPTPARSTCR